MYESLIEAEELRALPGAPDSVVVDCRYDLRDARAGYRAYLRGHVPGAIYADLHDDLSGPPDSARGRHPLPSLRRMQELFTSFGISDGVQVVAYDDAGGSFAARLWWMLRYLGHRESAVLNGGFSAWVASAGAIEEQENRNAPRPFHARPMADRLVTIEEVPRAARLIDSREPARFRGEQEPLDPVAGHIPGAHNFHWMRNLDAQGRFRGSAEVRRQLEEACGGCPAADAVFYCGSGVTACVNVLAAVHAGLPFPRLYAGSWSEWCSDPARPVETGA